MICTLGLFTVAQSILFAVAELSIPLLALQALEIAGFILSFLYIAGSPMRSAVYFRIMLAIIGLIAASVGIICPNTHAGWLDIAARLLATVAVVCVTVIYCRWSDWSLCRRAVWIGACAFVLAAVAETVKAALYGNLFATPAFAYINIWICPALALTVLGCYAARMRVKTGLSKAE